jgi:feruloyl esterase
VIKRSAWIIALVASLAFDASRAHAVTAGTLPATAGAADPASAADRCRALLQSDYTALEDAPTQITAAELIEAGGGNPAVCRVRGYVAPQVSFELRLPAVGWNGRFMEVGDGGWGGHMFLFLCDGPVRRGYACLASDMGHQATSSQALWARGNWQAQADFGYRATHVAAVAGKAIVRSFYAKPALRSVMFGCSTGGYQGMVEAQRFPWDFDGIIALSPDAEDEADLGMRVIWHMRNFLDENGAPVFDAAELGLLHTAALERCDLTDGVKDGIIGDPLACRFDPSVLACRAGQSSRCLTPRQVAAARNIYAGPMTSAGVRISSGGMLPGSELGWGAHAGAWATELFKYALFSPTPGGGWKPSDFDFDEDYKRLGLGALYTDGNPDLRKLKAAGGKLLVIQGGNDTQETPGAIVDYYQTVEKTMGGRAATRDFFRLFMIPGMNHCTGGDGAFAVDYLRYLENWMERGKAPDEMVGAHVESSYLLGLAAGHAGSDADRIWWGAFALLDFPLDRAVPVSFTRPIYPYPEMAIYKGSGNANDASNFSSFDPTAAMRRARR